MLTTDLDAYLADVAGRSKPATVAFYSGRSAWIRNALGALEWSELTPQKVRVALDQANRRTDGSQKAPDTMRGNVITWQQFEAWAVETGRIAQPVMDKPLPKPTGRQRDWIPVVADVAKLLDGAPPEFASIYRVLLLTGARPGELCQARIADFNRGTNIITLADHKTVGKTHRPREIPVSTACRPFVLQAIADRTSGPIFLHHDRPWTTAQLSQAFRRLRDRKQLDRRWVLYSARHKFATELCHAMDIEAAATVLGHRQISTTRRYVHHDSEQLLKYADGVNVNQLLPPTKETPPDEIPNSAPEIVSSEELLPPANEPPADEFPKAA
jgi:integrase